MKTYWWRNREYPNLGDEITPLILNRLFAIEPEHTPLNQAEFASTGSLLGWLWENGASFNTERAPLQVVGSGFMTPDVTPSALEFLNIHSVRGYLSKNKLGRIDSSKITVGDPGLLLPSLTNNTNNAQTAPPTNVKYGLILHHKHAGNQAVIDRFAHLPLKPIDIRTADIDSFVAELQSCEIIISQSLHGLVFADALEIPNVWLELGPIHSGGNFKFLDYFSTVGREPYRKISSVPKEQSIVDSNMFRPNSDRLAFLRNSVLSSFKNGIAAAHSTL